MFPFKNLSISRHSKFLPGIPKIISLFSSFCYRKVMRRKILPLFKRSRWRTGETMTITAPITVPTQWVTKSRKVCMSQQILAGLNHILSLKCWAEKDNVMKIGTWYFLQYFRKKLVLIHSNEENCIFYKRYKRISLCQHSRQKQRI